MSEFLAEHWVLSIVATIFLGAIGSGLWDVALKPFLRKIGSIIFTLITFGAKRAHNKIYKGAAMGHHELPSLYILLIVIMAVIVLLIAIQLRLYVTIYAPEISEPLIAECLDTDVSKQKECIREQAKERVVPILQVMSLFAIFISVIFLYRFVSINRMNLITTYYEQCLRSVRPFIDERTYLIIAQRYAMMSTKEDYEAIISQMAEVAKTNDAKLPERYL